MSQSSVPVSQLIKEGVGIGNIQEGRRTKNDYRKQKDLEEERKLGIAPAMTDVITGRDINPHIPEFIAKGPWYVPSDGPTLQHQRPHQERQVKFSTIGQWYKRGLMNKVTSKYREGACENCGALTHKKKDCLERPRKLGARWTGEDISADEHLQPDLTLNYDAKRDRWNGYDPRTYKQVVEEYEMLEQTRKLVKEQKMKDNISVDEQKEAIEDIEEQADEDMYADDADMAGVTVDMDSRTRITVRNLRIREDTAKYLHNLDPDGPYYDPKSRSMRENPFADLPGKEKEAAKFSGENFIRYTGEVMQANEAQVFAWQARCKGIDVHATAEPTKLESMKKEFESQKYVAKDEQKNKLLEKYGGEEHLKLPEKELIFSQSEHYAEYSRTGKIVKGEERPVVRSRYDEDKLINNHKSIWGSYWNAGRWGYACCHSFLKNSYCVGDALKKLDDTSNHAPIIQEKSVVNTFRKEVKEEELEVKEDKPSSSSRSTSSASLSESHSESESDNPELERQLELERLQELEKRKRDERRRELKRGKRKRQKERKLAREGHLKGFVRSKKKQTSDDELDSDSLDDEEQPIMKKVRKENAKKSKDNEDDDRDRPYNTTYEVTAPTEAELETYRVTKVHSVDPMAKYLSKKRRENA